MTHLIVQGILHFSPLYSIQVKNLGNVGREHGKGSVGSGSFVIGNGAWECEGNGNLSKRLLIRYNILSEVVK